MLNPTLKTSLDAPGCDRLGHALRAGRAAVETLGTAIRVFQDHLRQNGG